MKRYRHVRWRARLVLLLILFAFLFAYAEAGIRSAVREVSLHQIQTTGTQFMNEAMGQVLDTTNVEDENLTHVTRTSENQVSSIEVDSLKVNQLRTQIVEQLLEKIQQMDVMTLSIPLGTLLRSDFLTARGPKVSFKLYPCGYLNSKIVSQLDAAGINQTRHRIVLELSMEMEAVMPFYKNTQTVETEFVLAETIIVGEVPEYYTKVVSEDQSLLSAVNDYGNQTAMQIGEK